MNPQPRDIWGDDLGDKPRSRTDSSSNRKKSNHPKSSGKRRSSNAAGQSGSSHRSSSASSRNRSATRNSPASRNSSRGTGRSNSRSRHEQARERRSRGLVPAISIPSPRIFDRVSVRTARIIAVVVIVAALALMIYPAARELFISKRDLERANIELTEINNRNQQIQDDINAIKTDEGVESYVREQFGWVKDGETAVTVTGIPASSDSDSLLMPEGVNSTEVEPISDIFNGVLSTIFLAGD